jgi:outer membrane protein assembly factor BamB
VRSYPYGDQANSGRCPGPALGADPVVRWSFEARATVVPAPVVADGAVFFADDDGTLYALDAATGAVRWTWGADDPDAPRSPVEPAGDLVLVESNEVLHAVGRADGVHRWSLDGVIYPVVAGDLLVDVDGLSAVDLVTGEERWTFTPGFGVLNARPAVADGVLVVTGGFEGNHTHGGVAAVDLATGEPRWSRGEEREGRNRLTVSPVHAAVVDATVWVVRDRRRDGRTSSELAALDAATGADRRVYEPPLAPDDYLMGSVVVGPDLVYCHTASRLVAVDPRAGGLRFAVGFDAPVTATPLLAGGVLHTATDDGRLHGVDATDGTVLFTTDIGDVDWPEYEGDEFRQRESPFTLAGGVAYVRDGATVSALG